MSGEISSSKDAGKFEKLARMAVLLLRTFNPISKVDPPGDTERYPGEVIVRSCGHIVSLYSSLTAAEAGTRRRKVNRQLISLSELAKPGARQIISERVQQRLQPEPGLKEDTSAPTDQHTDQVTVSKDEDVFKFLILRSLLTVGGSFKRCTDYSH